MGGFYYEAMEVGIPDVSGEPVGGGRKEKEARTWSFNV